MNLLFKFFDKISEESGAKHVNTKRIPQNEQ